MDMSAKILMEQAKLLNKPLSPEMEELIIFAVELAPVKRLLLPFIILLTLPGFTQRTLLLERIGSGRWFPYTERSSITFQIAGESFRYTGTITGISDSGFSLDMSRFIRLDQVKYVWRAFPGRKANGNRTIIAGAVLIGITTINNLANGRTAVDPVYLAVGAGISAVGVFWRSLSVRRYPVGTRWKLKVFEAELK